MEALCALRHETEALSAVRHETASPCLPLETGGSIAILSDRVALLEVRAPGSAPLATMGDIDAYRTSACNGLGQDIGARVTWCERNLAALVKVVTNPRAAVGLQNAAHCCCWPAQRFGPARERVAGVHPSALSEPARAGGAGPRRRRYLRYSLACLASSRWASLGPARPGRAWPAPWGGHHPPSPPRPPYPALLIHPQFLRWRGEGGAAKRRGRREVTRGDDAP
jgi:hypothetical protein